ncbi:hypothetical protein BGZ94_008998 [Podila epigama]|nr:hypothetical protein BGZ94_008998 [Podila epigama]
MNTTTNNTHNLFSLAAAERLLQSANSLDSALSSDKKQQQRPATALFDFGLDTIFNGPELSTNLFDDWLLNDVQQAGFMGNHDDFAATSSSSDSDSNNGDSPVVGFDSIISDAELMGHSGGQASPTATPTVPMALFPEIQTTAVTAPAVNNVAAAAAAVNAATAATTATSKPMLPMSPLSPEAVRQAAAALNIPWSKGLEEAVLAQSLLASIPMALAMPLAQPAPAATAAVIAPRNTTTVATPKSPVAIAMATASSSPRLSLSPSPSSSKRSSPSQSPAPQSSLELVERTKTTTPLLAPATTPRLSILSTTQTTTAGMTTGSVKATVYKSAYRSASLPSTGRRSGSAVAAGLKRDREWDDTPSVLEGKDITEMDEVALKRAKNTDAARRSRRKKLILMEGLEQRVAELEVENSMFEAKLNEVELERSLLADKDQMQQARIMELEAMLASLRQKMY